MRRIKTILLFLVTAGLIAAGANLPKLTAALSDRETMNQAGSHPMQSVSLDLSGERKPLSPAGKLVLLRGGKTIAITENEANMTQAEINGALETQMEAYIDAGIFAWFDYTSWITQPYLCIDPDKPENYGIFWTVTIVNENEPYQSLLMDIDDETGRICSIRFDQYSSYSLDGVWERNHTVMDAFARVYLSQLGLIDAANAEPNLEYGELDGEVLFGGFTFTDSDYGQIPLEFYVTGSGSFWLYIPEFLE